MKNSTQNPKQAAGEQAAQLVKDNMVVGLGTGSTTAYAIKELGRRVADGLDILGVPTSYQSAFLAAENGIPLTTLDEHPVLDIDIDGADQVANFVAIKGGGAAHTREKIVAESAKKFVVVADESKMAEVLSQTVPLEVIPFGAQTRGEKSGKTRWKNSKCEWASSKDGPVISDNGNFILDADFGEIR